MANLPEHFRQSPVFLHSINVAYVGKKLTTHPYYSIPDFPPNERGSIIDALLLFSINGWRVPATSARKMSVRKFARCLARCTCRFYFRYFVANSLDSTVIKKIPYMDAAAAAAAFFTCFSLLTANS